MSRADRPLPRLNRARRALGTSWRVPLGACGGLSLAVLLALFVLPVTGMAVLDTGNDQSTAVALGPWLGLGLTTMVGLVAGASVIAVLVRQLLAGAPTTLSHAWGRTWTVLPKVLATIAGIVAVASLAVLASLPLALVFFVRSAWLMRSRDTRAEGLRGLWLAVPGAAAVAIYLMLPVTWAALLAGQSWREAVAAARRQRFIGRLAVLGGLSVVVAAVVGLSWWSASSVDQPSSWSGVRPLLALAVCELMIVGAALGLLGHRRGESTTQPEAAAVNRTGRRSGWRQNRLLASTSVVAIASLLIPLAPGLILAGAQAAQTTLAAFEPDPNATLVVNTLTDTTTPGPDDCIDDGAPCGIRAALDRATRAAAEGGSPRVEFAVNGTITLADTLSVPSGITVDATGQQVTLDAHQDFRALVVSMAQESEGASVTLRGFTVTGGRSEEGGAGLFSDANRVRLEQMTFTDNKSGIGSPNQPNGGAVAVPYTTVYVVESTFVDNTAQAGVGGAVAGSTVRWENSTSVRNDGLLGRPEGGAIFSRYGGTVAHATVIDGGGVAGSEDGGNLTVVNSAIRAAMANFPCARINSATDLGTETGNVDNEGTCLGARAPVGPIGELADNGGPTQTVALFPGSAAIGAGEQTQCLDADQRGQSRNPSSCDAGAFQTTSSDIPDVTVTLERLNDLRVGQSVELAARMTSEAALPDGTVRFLDGIDVLVADRPVVDGVARAQLDRLPQGKRILSAEFVPANGTDTFASDPVDLLVRAPVRTTLTSSTPARLHDPVTVTVTVEGNEDEAGVPHPTGKVHFTSGTRTHDADLVDGTAEWTITELDSASVDVLYDGDDAHQADADHKSVTTEDVATTTTATIEQGTVPFGDEVIVGAEVVDAEGPTRGRVRMFVDGSDENYSGTLNNGRTRLTAELSPGTHTAHLVYQPETGWGASQSADFELTVTPAAGTIVLAPVADRTYHHYDPMTVEAQLTGPGRSGASVRLLDGDRVVATTDTNPDGVAVFRFLTSDLGAGTYALVAEVVASDAVQTARSAPVRFTIRKADVVFNVPRSAPSQIGGATTIEVRSGMGDIVGTVELRNSDDGTVLGTNTMDGDATWVSFTPDTSGWYDIDVVFIPDAQHPVMRNYKTTTQKTNVDVQQGHLQRPSVSWSDPVTPQATLTVDFGTMTPPVTGSVTLIDPNRGEIATATVSDGRAELTPGGALAGHCLCGGLTVRYHGSGAWLPMTTFAPDVQLPSWSSTTTLGDLPETVGRGENVRLSATVASPYAVPGGEVVFIIDGEEMPATALENGVARLSWVATYAGDHKFSARFVPATGMYEKSVSQTRTVRVSLTAEPTMTLTGPDDGRPLRVGSPATFTARVATGAWLIPAGATITVVDSRGLVVGTGEWLGPILPSATISVTPKRGGPQQLRAVFDFDGDRTGTSAPLDIVVSVSTPLLVEPIDSTGHIGSPLRVAVSLDRRALADLDVDAAHVLVTLRNYQDTLGAPVALNEANNYRAVITYTPRTRQTLLLNAITFGNADVGFVYGQSENVEVKVRGLTTVATVHGVDDVVQGDYWDAEVAVPNVYAGVADPTGRAFVELRDDAGNVASSCSVLLPATSCRVGTWGISPGRYSVSVKYEGDDIYDPITNFTDQVFVITGTSRVELSTDTDPSTWLVGQQVSVTWRTHDPRAAEPGDTYANDPTDPGRVYVVFREFSQILCSNVPAADGGCTFTVPDYQSTLREKGLYSTLEASYTPATDTPASQTRIHVRTPAHCRIVNASNAITWRSTPGELPAPVVSGTTCSVGGVNGYVEGTQVTVIQQAPAPENYTFTGLDTGGVKRDLTRPEPGVVVFELEHNTSVKAGFDWTPACATVRVTDEAGHRVFYSGWRDPGWIDLETPSNCAGGTLGETVGERAERVAGVGHYLLGTIVEVTAIERSTAGTVKDPSYDLIGLHGTTPADETHPSPYLTATSDVSIYPQWRISASMCTRLRLYAGPGGDLAVSKATVPTTYLNPPADGRCETPTGEAGLLAGTAVNLTATPNATPNATGPETAFVDRWWGANEFRIADEQGDRPSASGDPAPTLAKRLVGSTKPSVPVTRTEEIPLLGSAGPGARFGVGFAQVDCVPVTVEVDFPVGNGNEPAPATTTPSNCAARTSTTVPVSRWVPRVGRAAVIPGSRTHTTTVWYVRGTKVDVATSAGMRPWSWSYTPAKDFTLAPRWKASFDASFTPALTPASTTSGNDSRVPLTATRATWLRAAYMPAGCGIPNVATRIAWDWDVFKSSGLCPDTEVDPDEVIELNAKAGTGGQLPVWTVSWDSATPRGGVWTQPRHGGKGTTYVGREFSYWEREPAHRARIGLTYCTPLDVTVAPVNADGKPLTDADLATLNAAGVGWSGNSLDYLDDEGGCPASLMGLANTSRRVGLTDAANQRWVRVSATLNGRAVAEGTNPAMRVDGAGAGLDRVEFKLTPRCYYLEWSDWVDVDTAANCGGRGDRWYVAGTAVAVHYDGDTDREFEHWEGVDAAEEGNAVVVMNRTRKPIAHWDNLSIWEQAGNFFSSLAQRALAALTTAALAFAGKVLLVGNVASLLMGGIASGLEAIGAGGAVADRFRQGSEAVDAAVDLATATTTCVSSWANGGASPVVPREVNTVNTYVGGAAAATGVIAGALGGPLNPVYAGAQVVKGATETIAATINVTNAFGAGSDAYFGNARDAWSSIGDIGTCLDPAVDRVARAGG